MSQANEATIGKRKSFRPYAIVSLLVASLAAAIGIFVAVAPATAASLTQRADAQIAAFVVPLTLLLLVVVVEVTRFATRPALPEGGKPKRTRMPHRWRPGENEG